MGKFTKDSGRMERKRDMVSGKVSKETAILGLGWTTRQMDMVYIRGSTAIDTRENGKPVSDKAKERTFSATATYMSVFMLMENLVVRDNTNGSTATLT